MSMEPWAKPGLLRQVILAPALSPKGNLFWSVTYQGRVSDLFRGTSLRFHNGTALVNLSYPILSIPILFHRELLIDFQTSPSMKGTCEQRKKKRKGAPTCQWCHTLWWPSPASSSVPVISSRRFGYHVLGGNIRYTSKFDQIQVNWRSLITF